MTTISISGNRAPLETEAPTTPPLVFPPAAKYEITYIKANGETVEYVMSNPIEEDAESFTAYVFGRGVRTFIKSRVGTVLRIYPDRIRVERGLLSKCYQDLNPRDIRSIDIDQSFWQRLVGIGDLTVSTSATVEASEELKSIPDPQGVRDLILAQRGSR